MVRFHLGVASLALLALIAGSAPSHAQFGGFGGLFGGAPPRPPSDVPNRPPVQPPPPQQPAPAQGPAAAPNDDSIQSQALPAPRGSLPGAPAQSAAARPAPIQPATSAQPVSTGPTGPQATVTPPSDEVITELPSEKIANPTAVFAGLDKITGRITTFEAKINETVQFGALQVTPRVCYTRPPTEAPNTDAFIEVNEVTLQGEVKPIFGGWVFAASPGLHAIEHPIYDVWLTDCKGAPTTVATAAAPPPRAAPAVQKPPPQRQQARPAAVPQTIPR
jgi:hypothetical protein